MSEYPLITILLYTYNHERFVGEALEGVFAQTYQPLEILISDDCSTDGTWEVIQRYVVAYRGPHTVVARRNEHNLGLSAHLNYLNEIAKGELIVNAAGDDISLPERVEQIAEAYLSSGGRALSIYSAYWGIDEHGKIILRTLAPPKEHLSLEWFANTHTCIAGCTQAWHRRLFSLFGPMDHGVISEDMVIPFRAALLGEVAYIDQPLVKYRLHSGNLHYQGIHPGAVHYAGNLKAVYQTRQRDLDTLADLFPARKTEIDHLQRPTARMLLEAGFDESLILSNPLGRLPILLRASSQGIPVRRILRWITIYYFPRAYNLYRNYALRKIHVLTNH